MPDVKARVSALRQRWPWLDHAIRAYSRYNDDSGDRLAAALTYFGFLSIFPLLALAFSVLGYVLAGDAIAQARFEGTLEANLPGLIGGNRGLDVNRIVAAKAQAGVLGLAGLLFAGLGWVDAVRDAIRTIWHQKAFTGNVVSKKFRDILILAGLGLALGVSIAVTAAVTAASSYVLRKFGLDESLPAKVVAQVLGVALALVTSTGLFLYLFTRLPRLHTPWRRVVRGAILAAALFECLKLVGSFYVQRTTSNPVYGTAAIAVGLLVWINLVSRIMLMCAAWTVTAPGDSDVSPSGTSSPAAARAAGLPESAAGGDAAGAEQEPVRVPHRKPSAARTAAGAALG
ncbi:MAG: YihY/virulence factor BrkB family protein, partial [Mycobacteriales bacterium]